MKEGGKKAQITGAEVVDASAFAQIEEGARFYSKPPEKLPSPAESAETLARASRLVSKTSSLVSLLCLRPRKL